MTPRRTALCECGRLRSHTPDEATHDAAMAWMGSLGWLAYDPSTT